MAADFAALDLPQLFSPAQAAEILRSLGLPEMTECALRTRAYRGQVPFHLNGRRIRFTITDLREIAEGQPRRPRSSDDADVPIPSPPAPKAPPRGRSRTLSGTGPQESWRARRSLNRLNGSPDPRYLTQENS